MPGGLLPVLQVVVEPRYAASDEQGVVVRSVAAVVFAAFVRNYRREGVARGIRRWDRRDSGKLFPAGHGIRKPNPRRYPGPDDNRGAGACSRTVRLGVLLGIIYFAGVFATLGWTVCNIVRVVRMTRRGQRIPLGNGSVLVLSDRIRAPFSWMRYVVMSEEDYACGGGTILVHEQAHQRLGHSWDLLLVDLLGCLQWFNPAMWLLRVELRAVHEYEADEQVLRCGVDAKDYQMLLIKKAVGREVVLNCQQP